MLYELQKDYDQSIVYAQRSLQTAQEIKAVRETKNADGMDMVLVAVDKAQKTLEFAGAKNPLIYIQNNELFHIKGDKMPIGGEQKEATRNFTKHLILLLRPLPYTFFLMVMLTNLGGNTQEVYDCKPQNIAFRYTSPRYAHTTSCFGRYTSKLDERK